MQKVSLLEGDHGERNSVVWYGGGVVFCDGTRCLVCLQLLDQEEMARDSMTPEQGATDARIYGIKRGALAGTGPMVVSINGAVASIAVTEFMVYVTGLRQPAGQLTYLANQQVIRRSLDPPEEGCYYCTGLWGSATT